MLNAILKTLLIMGWLGVVLGILAITNIGCGTICNISDGEKFKIKKMLKGILKVLAFYISAVLTAVAFTILPYINTMITDAFNVTLLSAELLNTLSSVGVLTVVIASISTQGTKAIANISRLSSMSTDINEDNEEE